MKFFMLSFMIVAMSLLTIAAYAGDVVNGNSDRKQIEMSQPSAPRPPHLVEPEAYYTISTATVDITFDATYYSEYTVHLVGEYTEQDIFVNSQVVYIPVATFGDIVDIYPTRGFEVEKGAEFTVTPSDY